MTGTAATITNLYAQFPTLVGAGRYGAQQIQNVVATLQTRTPVYYVNDPEYGAVGNGSSNPASTRYASLGALQAFYGTTVGGVTIALTNELDWLAHQKAIDIATAAGGAIISSSAFSYVMCNSNSVADGSGTLLFPPCSHFTPGNAVSWIGENEGGTNVSWPVDLGTGRFGVLCNTRATLSSVGEFSNLVLAGPGVGSTLNASTCNMQGIGTSDRRAINKMTVGGFNYGINIVGGQFLWSDVNVVGCFYGIYWDNPSTVNYGNMVFIRVVSETCKKAAVGVNASAIIGAGCKFIGGAFAESPYGIFLEITGGSSPTVLFMQDVCFDQVQFEGFGNAAVGDANATLAARTCFLAKVKFTQCQFSWQSANKIAALPAGAIIDVGVLDSVEIDQVQSVGGFVPGSSALINALSTTTGNNGGLRMTGDIYSIIANCVAAAGGASVNQFITNPFGNIRFLDFNGWEGGLCYNSDTTAVVGSVVTQTASQFGVVMVIVGVILDCPLGVLMYNPTPGTANSCCIYADKGTVTVKSSGTTLGKWLRTAAAGASVPATNSADVTTPMIGYGTTTVSGGTCTVKLKGLS